MSEGRDTPERERGEEQADYDHDQGEGYFEGEEEQLENSECRITDEDLDQIAVVLF